MTYDDRSQSNILSKIQTDKSELQFFLVCVIAKHEKAKKVKGNLREKWVRLLLIFDCLFETLKHRCKTVLKRF